ncbi:MAG: response regulator [Syntrophobacteraceae bacterium]
MCKVLLVDDDEDLLFLIGEYLQAHGIEFDLAQSAAQARKRLKYCKYDLVISDLNMPDESGLDLFRSVSSRRPGLPFILMSGNLDSRLRREAMSMGVCDFVEKPFYLSDLKQIIIDSGRCVLPAAMGVPAA